MTNEIARFEDHSLIPGIDWATAANRARLEHKSSAAAVPEAIQQLGILLAASAMADEEAEVDWSAFKMAAQPPLDFDEIDVLENGYLRGRQLSGMKTSVKRANLSVGVA